MIREASSSAEAVRLGDHSADRRMIMLAAMALFVGSGGAASAWVLLNLIALATNLFWFGRLSFAEVNMADNAMGTAVLAIPMIGSVIVGLMARFGSEKIRGHGIPEAIETILFGESRLSVKVAILKPVSSAISIGSGGPFGAEGPIIMTGGAIGSLFAQCFHLSAAERKTLLVAGAAAGMTAIFGTPLAAILLAIEVLLFEWKPRSFVPVVLAVLVSFTWRPLLISNGPMFAADLALPAGSWSLASALGMGLLLGLQAALLLKALYWIEDGFHHLPVHWMWWPALGSIAVGLGGLVEPQVLGAGYGNIHALLGDSLGMRAIIMLLVVKGVVWLIALGSGTSGGVLAPLLILGGALGCLMGQFLPGDPGFWAMIGMAGIMSGAMRAPLTGALFAAELTGQFAALPFCIAVAVSAYAISVLLMRRSILTEKIARRGRHILQEYSVDALDLLQVRDLMTAEPETLAGDMPVCEVIDFFEKEARHRSYPVIDKSGRLVGLVSRSDVLRWEVEGCDQATLLAESLSDASQPTAFPDSPSGVVADLIVQSGIGRIPIVDPDSRKVVGILSRQDLLKARHRIRAGETERTRHVGGTKKGAGA